MRMFRAVTGVMSLMAATTGSALAGDLTVEVRGIASTRGSVLVALFDVPANFLDKPSIGLTVPATAKPVQAVFRNLKPGVYAVSSFHDQNNNGKLDKNFIGLPAEKYGFGNDAMGAMGPPTFKAASIVMGPENRTIVINLR